MTDTITIFDTTLRDGEQSPGCSMNTAEKLEVAAALVELGVDVIEAGFPIASPGDFEAVQQIARKFGDRATICGLARCRDDDIDRAGNAVADAEKKRIHVFLATSAIHREHKLKMDKDQIVQSAIEGVSRAKGFCDDIEFSPEDAARTETDFLCEVVEKAIEAGATTVNIPDTVGYTTPSAYFEVIRTLKEQVPNIEQAVISTHCHNDLGLAVANSLAAVQAGARQVECTINGLGERAGNAALEEIIMALHTRADYYGIRTNINTKKLFPTSRLVSRITGMRVQRNKAIVGQNAFAHEAGIHQHGILQKRETYEIMRPEDVGYVGETLVLGKHSGRHAVRARVEELGYDLTDEVFQTVYDGLMDLADKKKEIYDADIVALIEEANEGELFEPWKLISHQVTCGSAAIPTATICLEHHEGEQHTESAVANGPVDASFRALERVVGITASLEEFEIRGLTRGKDAQGEVSLEIKVNGRRYFGVSVSTDVVDAATRSYLKALNRAAADLQPQADPQTQANQPVAQP